MKTLVLSLSVFFGVLFVSGVCLVLYGKTLPEEYKHEISSEFKVSPEKLRHIIINYNTPLSWRLEKQSDGNVVTWSYDHSGKKGTFSFVLTLLSAEKTKLTLIESSSIRPALLRVLAKYFKGMTSSIEGFMAGLHDAANQP